MAKKADVIKTASTIIFGNEGNYTSVNKNDNGALSIGKLQWHGSRALELMRQIVSKAGTYLCMTRLGLFLTNEIKNPKTNWDKRTLSDSEKSKFQAMLKTAVSIYWQNDFANRDVEQCINTAMSYGVKNCGVLMYIADGLNQYGRYSNLWKDLGHSVGAKGTLEDAYQYTLKSTALKKYITRRKATYDTIRKYSIYMEDIEI